jgi:hypothetical protein
MGIYQTQCREILRASVSTVRQMVRACRRNLETNYGAHSAESGLFTFDLKGLVAQRDLAMDREALFATTARVHEHLQSDHRERATCAAKMPCTRSTCYRGRAATDSIVPARTTISSSDSSIVVYCMPMLERVLPLRVFFDFSQDSSVPARLTP